MQQQTLKEMAHSRAMEAAVIGSVIQDENYMPEVLEIVGADDFYHGEMKEFFEAAITVWRRNGCKGLDGVTLREYLESRGEMDSDTYDLLEKVVQSVPHAANAVYYANAVKRISNERQLAIAIERLSESIYDKTLTIENKKAMFEAAALQLGMDNPALTAQSIGDIAVKVFEDFMSHPEGNGLMTGFTLIDEMTRGFCGGQFVVIASRPSMGKSAISMDMALFMAKGGHKVGFFSMEMSPQSLIERCVASEASVDLHNIRKNFISLEQKNDIAEACERLQKLPMWIDGSAILSPSQLLAKLMRLKVKSDIEIAFIDYLQLMKTTEKVENRQLEVTKICSEIKGMAKKLNIPIVLLCQLNRMPEQREDHIPRMSDLRESGAIENDADIILFLHRDDYYRKMKKQDAFLDGLADVIVAKNRQGMTGRVKLTWLAQFFSFKNRSMI